MVNLTVPMIVELVQFGALLAVFLLTLRGGLGGESRRVSRRIDELDEDISALSKRISTAERRRNIDSVNARTKDAEVRAEAAERLASAAPNVRKFGRTQ